MRKIQLTFVLALVAAVLAGCASSPSGTTSTTTTGSTTAPQTREYHLFTTTVDFNETALGIPHDTFTPTSLFANKGDTIVVHYHNLEDTDEHHTFTMAAPFGVDKDLAPNEEANITLQASQVGIFPFVCKYHQPTMTGYVVVVG